MFQLNSKQKIKIAKLAKKYGLEFVRLFGSRAQPVVKQKNKNVSNDSDFDIVVGANQFSLLKQANLQADLEVVFQGCVDLVYLRDVTNSILVLEIAGSSIPLWEKRNSGCVRYAMEIDRLTALAYDEELSYPSENRKKDLLRRIKKIGKPNVSKSVT